MGREADAPSAQGSLIDAFQGQQEMFLPFNMVRTGAIGGDPGDGSRFSADRMTREAIAASGLSRAGFLQQQMLGETLGLTEEFAPRFINLQSSLRQQAIQADPLSRGLQEFALENLSDRKELTGNLFDAAGAGIEGLESGGLPSDIQRNIEQSTRQALAARGMSESGLGGTLEALNLVGGTEALRSRRLTQAQQILAGGGAASSPGLAFASPAFQGMFGPQSGATNAAAGMVPGLMQAQFQTMGLNAQSQAGMGSGMGSLVGAGLGAWFGGPMGMMAGSQLGGQAGSSFGGG